MNNCMENGLRNSAVGHPQHLHSMSVLLQILIYQTVVLVNTGQCIAPHPSTIGRVRMHHL